MYAKGTPRMDRAFLPLRVVPLVIIIFTILNTYATKVKCHCS